MLRAMLLAGGPGGRGSLHGVDDDWRCGVGSHPRRAYPIPATRFPPCYVRYVPCPLVRGVTPGCLGCLGGWAGWDAGNLTSGSIPGPTPRASSGSGRPRAPARASYWLGSTTMRYGNFEYAISNTLFLDHVSRVRLAPTPPQYDPNTTPTPHQHHTNTTPHAPCAVLYSVPVLIWMLIAVCNWMACPIHIIRSTQRRCAGCSTGSAVRSPTRCRPGSPGTRS